jgi:hypothetical protein
MKIHNLHPLVQPSATEIKKKIQLPGPCREQQTEDASNEPCEQAHQHGQNIIKYRK